MTEQETQALRIELHRQRVAHEVALGWHRLPHDCPSTIAVERIEGVTA